MTEQPLDPVPCDQARPTRAKRAYSPPTVTHGRRVELATFFTPESPQLRMLSRPSSK